MKTRFLFVLLSIFLFSCDDVKTAGDGVIRVSNVEVKDGNKCIYTLEGEFENSDDIKLKCGCDKFKANDRLDLIVIKEKKVDRKEVFYLVNNDTISIIPTQTGQSRFNKMQKEIGDLKEKLSRYKDYIESDSVLAEKFRISEDVKEKGIHKNLKEIIK